MPALLVQLELLQPLLLTAEVSDPNAVASYDCIPGSTLRGWLAQRAQTQGLFTHEEFQQLFLRGGLRFLHAYPFIDGARMLPLPLNLRQYDTSPARSANIAALDLHNTLAASDVVAGGKTQHLPGAFVSAGTVDAVVRPRRTMTIHVQRDPQRGRAWRYRHGREETPMGTVFRYEALAAGQQFCGVVLAEDATVLQQLVTLLTPTDAWLGRSRSASYGHVRVASYDLRATFDETPTPITLGPRFQLTLLSDLLLRDAYGTSVASADAAALSAALGLPVSVIAQATIVHSGVVGGFNRYWRLPLPQALALQVGSVITLETLNQQPPPADLMGRWLRDGLGERRNEGYGRVALNWLMEGQYTTSEHLQRRTTVPTALTTSGKQLAQTMAERLFMQQLDQLILGYVREHVAARPPAVLQSLTLSQISRLRTLVRQYLPSADTKAVQSAFLAFRAPARRGYERLRLHGQSGTRWIQRLLETPHVVWIVLDGKAMPDEQSLASPTDSWQEYGAPHALRVAGATVAYDETRTRRSALLLLSAALESLAQQRKRLEEV